MANKVEIEIDGKNQGAVKAINGVNKELIDLDRVSSGISGKLGPLGSMFSSMINPSYLLGAGIGAVAAGFTALVAKSFSFAAELDKTSQKVGVSVEALSQLKYASELADVSFETMEKGLKKLSVTVLDAQMGLKTAVDVFKVMGVSLTDNEGRLKTNETLLGDVADRFKKMEDSGLKTALAVKVFGRSGADLIPLLNEGADGLDEMRRKADEMGLTISTQTAADAAALKDELTRFKGILEGLAIKSLPWVTEQLMDLGYVMDLISKGDFKGFANFMLFDNTGLEAYKKQIRETGKALTDNEDENKKIEDSLRRQNTEIERLNKSWEGIGQKLRLDINTFGLDPQQDKLARLIAQAEEYHSKYDKIPGALSTINDYLLTQLFTLYKLNEPKGLEQGPGIPTSFSMEQVQMLHDMQIQLAADVTDQEMLQWGIREGLAEASFGNMAEAAAAFYEAGGRQSKGAFAMYKALSIAQAVISTYNAAAAALAPPPIGAGPLWGPILAASTIALGLANVARIASTSMGSTGGGGVGGASLSSPSASSLRNENVTNNNSKSIVVNVYGFVGMDKDAIARELAPAIEKAWADGVGNG